MRRILASALVSILAACTAGEDEAALRPAQTPIPLAELAGVAEREVGVLLEIEGDKRSAKVARTALESALIQSGLANGTTALPSPDDAFTCLRSAAANRGLQITSTRSVAPPVVQAKVAKLKPGDRWQPRFEDLVGKMQLELAVSGPRPGIAGLIDDVAQCERLIIVRTAKIADETVTLTAEAWFQRSFAAPELELRWKSLGERLIAAGWKPNDPALMRDPAFARLKAAVDAGRELLPTARETLNAGAELSGRIVQARGLIALKMEVMQVRGAKLVGLGDR